jgi:hypothetical protein
LTPSAAYAFWAAGTFGYDYDGEDFLGKLAIGYIGKSSQVIIMVILKLILVPKIR